MFFKYFLFLFFVLTNLYSEKYFIGNNVIELKELNISTSRSNNMQAYQNSIGDIIYTNSEILITIDKDVDINSIAKSYGLSDIELSYEFYNRDKIYKAKVINQDLFQSVNRLRAIDGVKNSFPNIYYEAKFFGYIDDMADKYNIKDPSFEDSWHINSERFNLKDAWSITRGEGIKIGIIDDGFLDKHSDFSKTDISLDTEANVINALNKHGTMVAGVIFANQNELGSIGVAPNSTAFFAKTRLGNGLFTSYHTTLNAFNYMKSQDIDIINCSWGSYSYDGSLDNIFQDLAQNGRDGKGILIFFATGNSGYDLDDTKYSNQSENHWVLGIGAVDMHGDLTKFSNYGSEMDFLAPGELIYTTTNKGKYTYTLGTSFASPYMAGVAGLVLSANPDLTRDEVINILKESTIKPDGTIGQNEFDKKRGYGEIHIATAVSKAKGANIAQPVNLSASSWSINRDDYKNDLNITKELSTSTKDALLVKVIGEVETSEDFISIFDKDMNLIKRLSGNINKQFIVASDTIFVNFTTDESIKKSGFTITVEKPSTSKVDGKSWSILDYDNNIEVYDTLAIDDAISLEVNLTGVTERDYDFIEIYSDLKLIKRFSGDINESLIIDNSSIDIRFISDFVNTDRGVEVTISKLNSGNNEIVWKRENYGDNENISKNLRVPNAKKIKVTISGELEYNCDFLTIVSNRGGASKRYSGVIDYSYLVDGDGIKIKFQSDFSNSKDGVIVKIEKVE